jgi:hypothetical protein
MSERSRPHDLVQFRFDLYAPALVHRRDEIDRVTVP